MTTVNINITNIASSTHPDDRVVFYSPANRNEQGVIISTAVQEVSLTDGVGTVDLVPGAVAVRFECLGIADTKEKPGYVPEGGPVTLADVIVEWTPALIDQGVLTMLAAVEAGKAAINLAADDANFARVTVGKNLYNPADDSIDSYIANGVQTAYAGYRTTDFIPVTVGESYALSVGRHVNFYDADRAFVAGSWLDWNPQAPGVAVAPAGAAFLRMSYVVSESYAPSNVQIEHGTTQTAYEPYTVFLDESVTIPEIAALSETVAGLPTDADVQSMIEDADFARVIYGKNLYNPAADSVDVYLFSTGNLQALAGYRTTDFIPVIPGESYAMTAARHWGFFDANKTLVEGSWQQNSSQIATVTVAPVGAAYLRMSYAYTGSTTPSTQQIEHGTTQTSYEPYSRSLDPSITVAASGVTIDPILVNKTGNVVTISSDLGGKQLAQEITLASGRNNVLNFTRVTHGGVLVYTLNDDVTPQRTQQGTVGGNHGLALMASFPSGTHDKTVADLGSVWTDGTYEYVLLDVDSTGKLFAGRKYTLANGAAVAPNSTPAADLTHVSGATNTATIAKAGFLITDQLAPWIQRKRQVIEVDGKPIADGDTRGKEVLVRETYDIHDYGVVYDWAKANIGQKFSSTYLKPAIGVETRWRFMPGGKTRHQTTIWEISPTTLGECGFMQAIALPGTVTRYLPGVAPISGLAWDTGVDLASLTTSQKVTTSNLQDSRFAPSVAVDVRSDLGLAIAIDPWTGAGESAKRIASTPLNLWDLRSTKKHYPNVTSTTAPGWGKLVVEGIRAYLTPAEATSIVADADPINAWVTLDHMC